MRFQKNNITATCIALFLLINTVNSKSNNKNSLFKKKKTPNRNASQFKCPKPTSLRTHKLISIDFFDQKSLNFIIQKIRHLQKNTNCHGALVSPFTFLNFLYHHSTGRFGLDCISRIVDRSNSVCLSQFLKITRRLSGKKNDVGSDMLTALHLKVSKLYADVTMVYKMRTSA